MCNDPPWIRELDDLLSEAVLQAIDLIGRFGAHMPFGLVLERNGTWTRIAAEAGGWEAMAETVEEELQGLARRDAVRAAAFVRDVECRSATDGTPMRAVQIDLDHAEGGPVTCVLPYTPCDDGPPTTGDLVTVAPRRVFFEMSPLWREARGA